MTNKQVEEAMQYCKSHRDCYDKEANTVCPLYNEHDYNCHTIFELYNRLKRETTKVRGLCKKKVGDLKINEWIEIMTTAGYEVTATSLKEQVEQIRTETAKEIIQLMKQVQAMFYDKEYVAIQKIISEKYGVEVK